MRRGLSFSLCAALLVAGLCTTAAAAVPEAERVPITDPEVLLGMGMAPDEQGVHRWVHAGVEGEAVEPEWYGTQDYSRSSIMGLSFVGGNDAFARATSSGNTLMCGSAGTWPLASRQLELPDGTLLSGMHAWSFDSHGSENMHLFLLEVCEPESSGGLPTITTIVDQDISSGNPGYTSAWVSISPPLTIDTSTCYYELRVRFGANDSDCSGTNLTFQKVRPRWQLQVSPAPAVATFADVPVGHMFFQYVEALADSGITAGCGGGNFCPDAALTRGQMAVFLAKALGLHWYDANH